MCEEFLTSEEIMEKIAELKIRLVFQQELEEEVAELTAASSSADEGQSQILRDIEERVLKKLAAQKDEQKQVRKPKRHLPRAARFVAAVALLIMVSVGSAMATVRMVQIGLLKLNVEAHPEYTAYGLVSSGETVDVPQEWRGDFYPTYIPEGFEFEMCFSSEVNYRNANGSLLSFSEDVYGSVVQLNTENANISSLFINGVEATLIERDEWTSVVWSANNRLFIVEMNGGKDEVLRVAASVILIR